MDILPLDFIRQGQNLFITGSSGTGKSHIATAIGYQVGKEGYEPATLVHPN